MKSHPPSSRLGASKKPTNRSPKDLLSLCESGVIAFNPARQTLDSHAEEYMSSMKIDNPDEQGFLQQVLYGVYRYRGLLKAFITSFFHKNR